MKRKDLLPDALARCLYNRSKTLRREDPAPWLLNGNCTTSSESILQRQTQALGTIYQRPPETFLTGMQDQTKTPQPYSFRCAHHSTVHKAGRALCILLQSPASLPCQAKESILHSMTLSRSFLSLFRRKYHI